MGDRLRSLAKAHGRPLSTMTVLANDPFSASDRRAGAEWFADAWREFDIQPGAHLRQIHYVLVSQDQPLPMVNGEPYLNTEQCWKSLGRNKSRRTLSWAD